MPIGELSDMVDFYMATDGAAELRDNKDTEFIPEGVN